MDNDSLKTLLDDAVKRINTPDFVAADPVQFPRRFGHQADVEVCSLLVSTIAWGNRTMICRDAGRLLSIMENSPAAWIRERCYESLDGSLNIHRTFFAENLRHYCRGLRAVLLRYGTVENFAAQTGAHLSEFPAWKLAESLNGIITDENSGKTDSRCLPVNLHHSALKRLNMALRWLVRRDGIVDMGVWNVITPAQLYIPMDVHVADVSRRLELLTRRSNDRKAVELLTASLRRFDPTDPVKYDFALFGLGIEGSKV